MSVEGVQPEIRIKRFCAYRERSQVEVRRKLSEYGLYGARREALLSDLITEGFLNEERFARAYARGKHYHNQWGRVKITQGLQRHQIGDYLLQRALSEIDDAEYLATLQRLGKTYWDKLRSHSAFARKGKTAQYLIRKGYEKDLVLDMLAQWA